MENKRLLSKCDFKTVAELISIIELESPDEISKDFVLGVLEHCRDELEKYQGSKHFNLPDRLIKEFTHTKAIKPIQSYCHNNYCKVSDSDIDIVVGGYEKWLEENNFQIIDLTTKNTQ